MLDLDRAREVVAAREQERINALVNAEAVNEEHRSALAASGAAMIAGQERNRQQRIAVHAASVLEARATKDHLAVLVAEREAIENRVGCSRADLLEAQKRRDRCQPPSPDDYPTTSELDAWKQRRAELDAACFRIAARTASEQTALDAALYAQWEAEAVYERAREAELRLRNEL